jgi:hypothetical protein
MNPLVELREIVDEEVRWLENEVEAGDDALQPKLDKMRRAKEIADVLAIEPAVH